MASNAATNDSDPANTSAGVLQLSVIVPLAPNETAWRGLIDQLAAALPDGCEVIVVHADAQPLPQLPWSPRAILRQYASVAGRARQQNLGAQAAHGHWLWFLHADSQLRRETLPALRQFLHRGDDALGYFELAFDRDGPRLAALNAWGANLRSHWLKMPFGDQGLLLPARRFAALGGFDESARYGEDHLLVWAARRAGLPIVGVGAALQTSARKYARHGWWRTTGRHLWLTLIQAWPQWRRLRRERR
ncbi:MAG: glycosyltransferase family 2 protein [Pseudomonadota bacterium]|nr:glycosyltransferase family 2 protein [Pseudomonadota bacterium]